MTQEVIRLATLHQEEGINKVTSWKETRLRLGQQLASATRDLAVAASESETHDLAAASTKWWDQALEDSRRRIRSLKSAAN